MEDFSDNEVLLQRLDEAGYVVLERRLTIDQIATVQHDIAGLLAESSWGSGFDGDRTRRAWAVLSHIRSMDSAALDPVVLELVDRILGPGTQFSLTQAIQIYPGQTEQFLHYEQGIYPVGRDHDVMMTAIWALDDFTATNGGTLVVPGSQHEHVDRPERSAAVAVEMPAGSVLLFRGRLWHAGGANISASSRLGVIIDYVQPWLRPCEAHTLSCDLAEAAGLPDRLQELLGFNQPSRYLGFVDGRHPKDWLADRKWGARGSNPEPTD